MSIRMRRRVPHAEHERPDERWMASYLDMITVLMCTFIVLFAMSTVDKGKFEALSASLAEGFGQTPAAAETPGPTATPAPVEVQGADAAAHVTAAQAEYDSLIALRERLRRALAQHGVADAATFTIDDRGLTIGLVSAETFFATNSTSLSGKATTVLDALGGVLIGVRKDISVEGYADHRSAVAPFATNWELSSGRSTQVLRYLVEARGLDPSHIKSVGFGDAHPVVKGSTAAALAQNRRVDIVVLSDAKEVVRSMLPSMQPAQLRH